MTRQYSRRGLNGGGFPTRPHAIGHKRQRRRGGCARRGPIELEDATKKRVEERVRAPSYSVGVGAYLRSGSSTLEERKDWGRGASPAAGREFRGELGQCLALGGPPRELGMRSWWIGGDHPNEAASEWRAGEQHLRDRRSKLSRVVSEEARPGSWIEGRADRVDGTVS